MARWTIGSRNRPLQRGVGGRALAAAPRSGYGKPSVRGEDVEVPLEENAEPENDEVYKIGPATPWHPDRVRSWMAMATMILLGLTLLGQFILVLTGASTESILAWQAAIGTVGSLTAAVTTFFFASKRNH